METLIPRFTDTITDMSLILVVEDEREIATILEGFLKQSGFRTERAADGETALKLFRSSKPDLVLLDIMLPKRDGVEVLKAIRKEGETPVIILSARSEDIDKLLGLELGADDYITKPFRPMEVIARIKAVLRRSQGAMINANVPLRVGPLEVDPIQATAKVSGNVLELTPTEYKILHHFATYPGRAFSRTELLDVAMPESDALERVIDVHIGNLRRKLEHQNFPDLIQTVRGMGFRLAVNE
jgi:two-component system, OmpR family, response regulator AdeR